MLNSLRLLLFLFIQVLQYSASNRVVEGQETTWGYNYTKYHPMSEITSWIEQMVEENPHLVSSSVYGHTFEGRSITLLKIGVEHPEGREKKAVWMDCGIHAREWIAPAFCQWFVKEILQGHRTDGKILQMLQNLDFYVTPVLNVDGYMYSWTNQSTRLWRKSRSSPPPGCSCHGVDLNRNFYANWGMVGVSFDCCQQTYGGRAAVSEKEAQAVTEFVGNRTENILLFLTIHSHGQLLLLPYGHPQISAPNYADLVKVGEDAAAAMKAVHGLEYRVGTSPQILYPNSGSSRDWARLVGIPFSYTFELRDTGEFGHQLPEEQIQPACEEAFAGARSIITHVHDNAFGNAAGMATAASTVTTMTIWTTVMVVGLTTGV